MFVARKSGQACIALIPKSGNSTIRTAVMFSKDPIEVPIEKSTEWLLRVAFIREPIDRVKSGFSHFRQVIEMGSSVGMLPHEYVYIEGRGLNEDYRSYIDYILENSEPHWSPQTERISLNGEIVCNRLHKLDDLRDIWEQYYTGSLPWQNAWTRLKVEDYRLDDLKEYYKDDYKIWDNL